MSRLLAGIISDMLALKNKKIRILFIPLLLLAFSTQLIVIQYTMVSIQVEQLLISGVLFG